jgi:hypothetical protein
VFRPPANIILSNVYDTTLIQRSTDTLCLLLRPRQQQHIAVSPVFDVFLN